MGNSNNQPDDDGEEEYTDSDVVDETYLQPPSYEEKRVKTSTTEAEREMPWWLDEENGRVQLIGKIIAVVLFVTMLSLGFIVFFSGGESFVPPTDNDEGIINSPNVDEIEATESTSVVHFVDSAGSYLTVEPAPVIDESLAIDEEKTIRLAGATVPYSDVDKVNPNEYGLEDTEENRECLARVGSEAETMIENELGYESDVFLFNHGEEFGNDEYDGPERYYVVAGEQTVSLTLIENGYAILPVWEFEELDNAVGAINQASDNGTGLYECGVVVDSRGQVVDES